VIVGGSRLLTYWETHYESPGGPFFEAPPGYPHTWGSADLPFGQITVGPYCRLHYCSRLHHEGLIVPPHLGLWMVEYNPEFSFPETPRLRWYCTNHLPRKYLVAIHEANGNHFTTEEINRTLTFGSPATMPLARTRWTGE
jgi:hypothetical protein